jgi:hypothetical protein
MKVGHDTGVTELQLQAAHDFDAAYGVTNDWRIGGVGNYGVVLFGEEPEPVALKVFIAQHVYGQLACQFEAAMLSKMSTHYPERRPL